MAISMTKYSVESCAESITEGTFYSLRPTVNLPSIFSDLEEKKVSIGCFNSCCMHVFSNVASAFHQRDGQRLVIVRIHSAMADIFCNLYALAIFMPAIPNPLLRYRSYEQLWIDT